MFAYTCWSDVKFIAQNWRSLFAFSNAHKTPYKMNNESKGGKGELGVILSHFYNVK